ncbi:MAG: coproporphyrinogen dehydrogenase HemZ [Eubacterium sp.]|nr:coproporphyrinogen dehydrogenase HemZ [Eubacterium sp.]
MERLSFTLEDSQYAYPCREMLQQFAPELQVVFNDDTADYRIEVDVCENRLGLAFYAGDRRELAREYTLDKDMPLDKECLKGFLYLFLCEHFKRQLDWGTLTGIKPVKMAHALMHQGKSAQEAAAELKDAFMISDKKLDLITEIAGREMPLIYPLDKGRVSVYIGVPICIAKCSYCSFISTVADKKGVLAETYLQNLCRELRATGEFLKAQGLSVDTLYIGGGTPSVFDAGQLSRLLDCTEAALDLSKLREYTFESGRPETTTPEKLRLMKAHGVGRICFNPQSMNPKTLEAVGRLYTPEDIRRGMAEIREVGFDAVNMDLILGLNHESQEDFLNSLEAVMAMVPENITVHCLSVKKGSAIKMATGHQVEALYPGSFYDEVQDRLRAAGYHPYYLYRQKYTQGNGENIGYSLPGKEGVYNILMMSEKQTIIGIGAGSSGKLYLPDEDRFERVFTVKDVRTYNTRYSEILEKKMNNYRLWLSQLG